MSTLNELNQRLEELETDIELAEQANAAASIALASAPHDDSAIRKARAASLHLADLRGDALLLREARAHAVEADRSEATQARKREAIAKQQKVEELAAKRMDAAVGVDRALAGFTKAMQAWVAVNDEMRAEVCEFYKLAIPNSTRWHQYTYGLPSLVDVIGNALADNVEFATRGVNLSHNFSLNFIRDSPEGPGSVAVACTKYGAGILTTMARIAEAEGLAE